MHARKQSILLSQTELAPRETPVHGHSSDWKDTFFLKLILLRTQRENGVTDGTSLFLNRTQEEMEGRKGKGKDDKGKNKANASALRNLVVSPDFTLRHVRRPVAPD